MSKSDAPTPEQLQATIALLTEQLRHAQRMSTVGVLASSITHEFNNILMTVINYAKLGLRQTDPASRDKAFEKILAAGQRAAKITTGMLGYSRQQPDRREAHDLTGLVEDLLVLVEKDLQMHRVRLQTRFEGRPWAIINAGQVQQVLLNLVINARQAMANGGTLTLGLRADPATGFAEVSVQDSGCGIPADKLARIFEPFYSTKTADSQGQGGTGLGLALAKEVMEAHHGRIRVESAVGAGTTFTLKFPASPAPTAKAPSSMQRAG